MNNLRGKIIKVLLISLLTSFASITFAAEFLTLSTYSFHNNKTIVIDDLAGNKKGIKVKVESTFRDEPASSPMYLSTYIQCPGKQMKAVDLARFLKDRYGERVIQYLGRPTKNFPTGQIHVCALENVNFDQHNLMISILKAGSSGCDQRSVVDFIFPIAEICP